MSGLLAKVPECIHDGSYTVTVERFEDRKVTLRTCDRCRTLLIEDEDTPSGGRTARFTDDTYALLYTRAGRLRIVREALEQAGWPIPRVWE